MSQQVEVFNLARTAYLRLISLLGDLGVAANIFVGASVGARLFGPVGAVSGALTSFALYQWASNAHEFFTLALHFISEYPNVVRLVQSVIDKLRQIIAIDLPRTSASRRSGISRILI